MAKIKLNDEDKKKLIDALNNETEPSADILPKLFPGTMEKFDVQKLDRAKIPTLEYAGKRSKAAILAEAGLYQGAPLQTVRCFGEAKENEWRNMIVQGDNLQFLKTCYQNTDSLIKDKVKGKVKLIYIDPPFGTDQDFDTYADKIDSAEFLDGLRERLFFMKDLLSPDGSIFVHLDWRFSHYIKIVMDEIFNSKMRNEIIWAYHGPGSPGMKQFNRKHDNILWYTNGNKWVFNENEIRIPYKDSNQSLRRAFDAGEGWNENDLKELRERGKLPEDWWEIAIIARKRIDGVNRTGYPTEKPPKLIERIIKTVTNKGDIVCDFFAGSGMVAGMAEVLGRRWIVCDFGKHAIYTIQKRMMNIAFHTDFNKSDKQLNENNLDVCVECLSVIKENDEYKKCSKCKSIYFNEKKEKITLYGKNPKPFCVVSAGAYDFSKVMELHKNKDAYINFVLGLFQLSRYDKDDKAGKSRDDKAVNKYKLVNIYGEKEGNPVEIFPAWDDNFLVNIRIDEDYLKQIIQQSGNKLKGDYYIITPETCTNVGDTTLSNGSGGKVNFKMLTFPYKILEDVSRNFQLEEQPSSQENVNQLITSTAFYFNEDVIFEVGRVKNGLKIKKFETKILDKEDNRFEGLDGLAMVLIDIDYNGKVFDMEKTVFLKDIDKENSLIKITGLTKSVAVIAVDKHGNESKVFKVK